MRNDLLTQNNFNNNMAYGAGYDEKSSAVVSSDPGSNERFCELE